MEPIPESLEALTRLSTTADPGTDLVAQLKDAALRVVHAVPECVVLGIAHFDHDVTFTLLATSDEFRVLDAAQYLDGGPCEVAAVDGDEVDVGDVLDEDRWQLFALASASNGVRSSLSLPLRRGDTVYGSINFYASTDYAFIGRERDLAVMFGSVVQEAVANADLSMSSLDRARRAPRRLDDLEQINMAVGVLTERWHISLTETYTRLLNAAERAGISPLEVAEIVLRRQWRT